MTPARLASCAALVLSGCGSVAGSEPVEPFCVASNNSYPCRQQRLTNAQERCLGLGRHFYVNPADDTYICSDRKLPIKCHRRYQGGYRFVCRHRP